MTWKEVVVAYSKAFFKAVGRLRVTQCNSVGERLRRGLQTVHVRTHTYGAYKLNENGSLSRPKLKSVEAPKKKKKKTYMETELEKKI